MIITAAGQPPTLGNPTNYTFNMFNPGAYSTASKMTFNDPNALKMSCSVIITVRQFRWY